MEISVIGISHHTAPVEVRERVALPPELAASLLRVIRAERIADEALILNTCNRTEIYLVTEKRADPLDHILTHVAELAARPRVDSRDAFYRHDGLDAVRHLFRVAATLDSQIVGDHEILGQLKTAYRQAAESGATGFALNKLLHWAFRVGKRVQTETEIGRGTASVPLAAVEVALKIFSRLSGCTVLLVGAGQTAERAAEALLSHGASRVIVANRTLSRAETLVEALIENRRYSDVEREDPDAACPALPRTTGRAPEPAPKTGRAVTLDDIPSVIGEVDLVISSTGSPGFVLTHEALGEKLRRHSRSLFILDIAVPRDVDPRLGDLSNVFVYSLDVLDGLVAENIERRRTEIPKAETIVEYEVAEFEKWLGSLQVVPTIKLLKEHFEGLQAAELARSGRKLQSADAEALEAFARSLCQKILHKPFAFLHDLSARNSSPEVLAAVDLIRQMFDLDATKPDED